MQITKNDGFHACPLCHRYKNIFLTDRGYLEEQAESEAKYREITIACLDCYLFLSEFATEDDTYESLLKRLRNRWNTLGVENG